MHFGKAILDWYYYLKYIYLLSKFEVFVPTTMTRMNVRKWSTAWKRSTQIWTNTESFLSCHRSWTKLDNSGSEDSRRWPTSGTGSTSSTAATWPRPRPCSSGWRPASSCLSPTKWKKWTICCLQKWCREKKACLCSSTKRMIFSRSKFWGSWRRLILRYVFKRLNVVH